MTAAYQPGDIGTDQGAAPWQSRATFALQAIGFAIAVVWTVLSVLSFVVLHTAPSDAFHKVMGASYFALTIACALLKFIPARQNKVF